MRPYAIYEHPDFSVSSGSITEFRKVATALTVVAASSAAVYEILVHKSSIEADELFGQFSFLVNGHLCHCSSLALFLMNATHISSDIFN
ncbi:hypothetical protein EDD16DRAFT_493349 [Pisolithus croceorrhizus]|nr:hypothetical protein EDD16DRAFT_493349 [Pisolithus croceorrhizus]KAI6142533.1 hypothetical protein EDD17DRAFT_1769137 [Pisolithus thermaeus]